MTLSETWNCQRTSIRCRDGMVLFLAFVLMFYSPYMCPKREYVEKRFDRVLETIQIRSAENMVFYDVCLWRTPLIVGRKHWPFNLLLRKFPWQLLNDLTTKRIGFFCIITDLAVWAGSVCKLQCPSVCLCVWCPLPMRFFRPVFGPEITWSVSRPLIGHPKVTCSKATISKATISKVTRPKVTRPKVTRLKVTRPKMTRLKVTRPKVISPNVNCPKVTHS